MSAGYQPDMTVIAIILVVLFLVAGAMEYLCLTSPEGYEDETGFHEVGGFQTHDQGDQRAASDSR